MFFVCFLAFILALAAFLVGWFEGEIRIHCFYFLFPCFFFSHLKSYGFGYKIKKFA